MPPKHIGTVSNDRRAIAPYNFVELPERVVSAPEPAGNHSNYVGHTGAIRCTLTAETPLYTRAALPPEMFALISGKNTSEMTEEQKQEYAAFFDHGDGRPRIPGSSLRGMLRSLVEIGGYGKVDRVTDQTRLYYRAVASKVDDSVARLYRSQFQINNVKAGYLERSGESWRIRTPVNIDGSSFVKIRETDVLNQNIGLVSLNSVDYKPQIIRVSFSVRKTPKGRIVGDQVGKPGVYEYEGTLVTSGNMLETGGRTSPRKNHCLIPLATDKTINISDAAIIGYRQGLTDFQKAFPFDEKMGVLIDGRPVFYLEPRRDSEVTLFGHTPNFRVPYLFSGARKAASPRDFVPPTLRGLDTGGTASVTDLADILFGFVRQKSVLNQPQATSGRVFFADAHLVHEAVAMSLLTPKILGTPKTTTFQHYLVQDHVELAQLKHYANRPGVETQIRGHKLYWHKPSTSRAQIEYTDSKAIRQTDPAATNRTSKQYTIIRPLDTGTQFSFDVRFESLSDEELGALLWALSLGSGSTRLKLGMGKPLGMGSVKIEVDAVQLSDRKVRYAALFDGDGWANGERAAGETERADWVSAFQAYVMEQLELSGEFDQLARIAQLKAMLEWDNAPLSEQTRYMEIERHKNEVIPAARNNRVSSTGKINEYSGRPVLPTPLDVLGRGIDSERLLRPQPHVTLIQPTPIPVVQRIITKGDPLEVTVSEQLPGKYLLAFTDSALDERYTIGVQQGYEKHTSWGEALRRKRTLRVIVDKVAPGKQEGAKTKLFVRPA